MKKVYVVIEGGGEYVDKWERVIGVCSTSEIADSLKAKLESSRNKTPITEYQWDIMYHELMKWEEDHEQFNSIVEGMRFLFPEWSEEDIISAHEAYDFYGDDYRVMIQEINFYDNITDIN